MKKIYIVLTYTGSMPSKLIKLYTGKRFSHVSISLNKELTEMYSFGRLYPYNPFVAGLVHESVNDGTFKRFKKTDSRIYELTISNHQYRKLKMMIKKMVKERYSYKFNYLGLLGVTVNLRIKRNNYFYCAEFVKYLLEESQIVKELPMLIKPMDFAQIETSSVIYEGLLKNY